MTVLHLDPSSGASGDMLLGAVLDAGAPPAAVTEALDRLGLPRTALTAEEVQRAGIGAIRAVVTVPGSHAARSWPALRRSLEEAALPGAVGERALATSRRLAAAEARVHRCPVDEVHLHEVGAPDAVAEVVAVCAGLVALAPETVSCGPVALGSGRARAGHGDLPVPAPAVLEVLRGAPVHATDDPVELCTPTGAALLAEWTDRWGPLPALVLGRTGYGAGSRNLARPNVLRLIVGDAAPAPDESQQALVLETAVDDLAGELVPPILDALRAAGAWDAWARPALMKKGRPGIELVCVAPPSCGSALRALLFHETSTLGVRGRLEQRWTLERDWVTVTVADAPVRLKLGLLDGSVVNVAPEFEDCVAAARRSGLPLKEVYRRAQAAHLDTVDGR